jgi:hypothetical protein
VSRGAAAALLWSVLAAPVGATAACRDDLPGAPGPAAESARYLVAYRTEPARIAVGEHFAVELVVCPRAGAPGPESVRVDAHMPEHRHGMNYRPTVTAQGDGRYRADGLLFHMPGHWELVFEVRAAGRTDRLTRSVELE